MVANTGVNEDSSPFAPAEEDIHQPELADLQFRTRSNALSTLGDSHPKVLQAWATGNRPRYTATLLWSTEKHQTQDKPLPERCL